jgi:hypothetical protein
MKNISLRPVNGCWIHAFLTPELPCSRSPLVSYRDQANRAPTDEGSFGRIDSTRCGWQTVHRHLVSYVL